MIENYMPLITNDLSLAAIALQAGKPVAIPTETVYGLAALVNKEEAIKAVYTMKSRPFSHPLIVHVGQNWDLTQWVANIPDYAHLLIKKFWPGPLTLVLNAKKGQINPLVTGGQNTVAIRCPAHPLALQLLDELQTPIVAPSANPFGKISPTTAVHVEHAFPDQELTILDGGRCSIGIESTIVDATDNDAYKILRYGLIDETTIAASISTAQSNKESSIRVPGKLDSHYQPQKKLYYFDQYESLLSFCQKTEVSVFVLANQRPDSIDEQHFHHLTNDPERVAYELYYQLRAADASKASCIAIQLPPDTSTWQGIRERILKAGQAGP